VTLSLIAGMGKVAGRRSIQQKGGTGPFKDLIKEPENFVGIRENVFVVAGKGPIRSLWISL